MTMDHRKIMKRRFLLAFSLLLAVSACVVRTEPGTRNVKRQQIVNLARNLAGIPYVFGGNDIDGFDCSGLVLYVFDCFGIRLPRSAREQAKLPGSIRLKHAEPGDILVFKLKKVWHSTIFMGENRFIHAPNSGGRVRIEALNPYWLSRLKVVVAVLESGH
jgi:cell wall-associated NlpC family hydrolase